MKKRYLPILLLIILCGGITYYLFKSGNLVIFKRFSPETSLYLIGLLSLYLYVYSLAIASLLKGLGYSTPLKTIFLIKTAGGAITSATPAKVGLPARIFLYKKFLDIPLSKGSAALVMEIFIYLLISAGILLLPFEFKERFSGLRYFFFFIVFVLISVFLILLFALKPRLVEKCISKSLLKKWGEKIATYAINFKDGLKKITKGSLFYTAFFLSSTLLIEAFASFLILSDFGYKIRLLHLLYIQCLVRVVGAISMIPMGIGSREVGYLFLLNQLNVPNHAIMSYVLTMRVLWTIFSLIIGVISGYYLGMKYLRER